MPDPAATPHVHPETAHHSRWWLQDRHAGWASAIALAVISFAVYLFVAGSSTLYDRDEGWFSRAAVEMVESGNYWYPTFNGNLRYAKPILIYWCMSLPLRLLGQTEIAVRLPSVVGMVGASLIVYWIGRTLWRPRVGLVAMAVVLSTPISLLMGCAATADGVLIFFLTACLAVVAHATLRGWRWPHAIALGLAMGFAQLEKGPVGAAIPVLSIALTWLMLRKASPKSAPRWLFVIAAVALGVAIFCAWAVPANRMTAGQFNQKGMGNLVQRVFVPLEGHGGHWLLTLPLYFPVLFVGFFPWTLYLMSAINVTRTGRAGMTPIAAPHDPAADPSSPIDGVRARALLVGWAVPTFVMMSFVQTKLPHYILPIWPALALAVAAALETSDRGETTPWQRVLFYRGGILFLPVGAGLAFGAAILPRLFDGTLQAKYPRLADVPSLGPLVTPLTLVAAAMLVMIVWAMIEVKRWRVHQAVPVLWVGMTVVALILAAKVQPVLEAYKPVPPIAATIRQFTLATVPVVTCGFNEPSLNFYVDRGVIEPLDASQVSEWARQNGPGVLVIERTQWDLIKDEIIADRLTPIGASHTRFNYSKGETVDLLVLARHYAEGKLAPNAAFEAPATQPAR